MSYRWNWIVEWSTPASAHMHAVRRVIYHGQSRYQDIMVLEYEELGKALVLDGKTQSALVDEFIYHEALVLPALILHGSPKRVLVLGGGEGATVREVLRFRGVEEVVMVDIDEDVVKVSREYLGEWHQGSFDDPRLRLVIGDGYKYIMEDDGGYDVIIADLADPLEAGPAYKLYTLEFYKAVKSRLRMGGVFVTQATSPTQTLQTHAVIYNTIASVFKYATPYHVYIKSFDGVWGFVVASDYKDPGLMDKDVVDEALAKYYNGETRFYDGESHVHMFTIPKYLKRAMSEIRDVATLEKPAFMPA
ncbi:MAG: polyamine aminopropyltransferase [Desulfurococcales archaeon]|nr:polyamine aminopropyltransferase [Desulfurococcales archaeon]